MRDVYRPNSGPKKGAKYRPRKGKSVTPQDGVTPPVSIVTPTGKVTAPPPPEPSDAEKIRQMLAMGTKVRARMYQEFLQRVGRGEKLTLAEKKMMEKLNAELAAEVDGEKAPATAEAENSIKLEALAIAWSNLGLILTTRRYRQIAKEGRVPEPVRGYVDAQKCLIQIAAYYQSMSEGRGDSTHEEIKKRRDIEKLAMEKMERKVMEGGLIDKNAVADELVKRTYMIKSDLLACEKRIVRWGEALDIIKKAHRHMMRTYSRKGGVFSE